MDQGNRDDETFHPGMSEKREFLWKWGVLGWGIPLGVLLEMTDWVLDQGMSLSYLFSGAFLVGLIFSIVIASLVGLFLFAPVMWWWQNRERG